ncbi:MAG: ABC transporter permease, partial [Acidimicrobiales bacterium]
APGYEPRGIVGVARDITRRPAGAVAASLILLLVLVAIFAPLIAPHNPDTINVANTLAGPSANHLLGTDSLGRDNLSRVLFGTRIALEVALPSVLVAFVVGAALGLVAGYLGGLFDKVLVVVFDALISFPAVILGLALLSFLGPSVKSVIFVIGLSLMPYYGRLIRAQTLSERKNQYVKAQRSLGASRGRVLRRHILPNVVPPLLVIVSMDIPTAIITEAGLAFLGLGVQPPTPDWGVILDDGFVNIGTSPWEILGPIIALVVMTTAFTVLGETMRDVLDPRQRLPRRRHLLLDRKLDRKLEALDV